MIQFNPEVIEPPRHDETPRMRLKRLVCRGFKSFADKTEFEFDSALTGIVGPNGCGKSNVVDALKWVLGDQRARSLRGTAMTDVIFKGAEGRDAMAAAEVEIHLEMDEPDAERREVTIGRRLNRDKESDYLLNGEVVRLKDVRGAMMDTGLGVGAYSVMEQGRIDAVLSANPEDRRAIFEEAAGISRFRQQKRETLRKLDRTEQNLSRLGDLLEERSRRIRSLKIQAGRARRYAELRDQLRDIKSAVAVTDARTLRHEQHRRQAGLEEARAALATLEAEHGTTRENLAALEARAAQGDAAMDALKERMRQERGQLDALQTRIDALHERHREQLAEAEVCVQRRDAMNEQHADRLGRLEEARARLDELAAEQQQLVEQHAAREHAAAELQAAADAAEAQREQARAAVLESIHRKTAAHNAAHEREAEIRGLRARQRRLDERAAAMGDENSDVERQRAALARDLEDARGRLQLLASDGEAVQGELDAARRAEAEVGDREAKVRERLSGVAGQVEVLEEMERHMEGLDQGPQHLLRTRPAGLRGRLLDVLEIDLEHGPALEAALGALVQALVVDTRDNAERILADLSEQRAGRALLLIEEEFHDDFLRRSSPSLPEGARPLADLVRSDERARPLVRWLLRGVCLVSTLEQARADRPDLCFVTAAGEMVCGPQIEGGRSRGQGGLLVRKAQRQQLAEEETRLRARLEALAADKQAAVQKVEGLVERLAKLEVEAQMVRAEEQEARAEERRAAGRSADLDREAETLQLELAEVRALLAAARAALNDRLLQALMLVRAEQRQVAAEARRAAALAAAQSGARDAAQAVQQVRLRQVACAEGRDGVAATVRAHEQGLQDLAAAADDLARREADARANAERAEADAQRHDDEIAALRAAIAATDAEQQTCAEALEGTRQERDEERAALDSLERRRGDLGDRVTALRIELSDFDHRFARLEDRLREDTGIELRRCLGEIEGVGLVARSIPGPTALRRDAPVLEGPPAPQDAVEVLQGPTLPPLRVMAQIALRRLWEEEDFDLAEAKRQADLLQSKIDRIGHVNMEAVAELEELESSFSFLEQQVADLRESRKSLVEALRRLETESRQLFEETFEKARANFQVMFRKLFQGGKADMQLSDDEDALEAGIDIVARPPGKQLQSINLLSGGERSMTALAILFAVFAVKPSPFCILDEVDAALDDSNVERFLRVLRDFVGPTQFCIVTHHKRTMAECQKLYGITMQRRGVSSRISVSLDEVDSFASGDPGGGGSPGGDRRAGGEDGNGDGGAGRHGAFGRDPTQQRIAGEEQVGF